MRIDFKWYLTWKILKALFIFILLLFCVCFNSACLKRKSTTSTSADSALVSTAPQIEPIIEIAVKENDNVKSENDNVGNENDNVGNENDNVKVESETTIEQLSIFSKIQNHVREFVISIINPRLVDYYTNPNTTETLKDIFSFNFDDYTSSSPEPSPSPEPVHSNSGGWLFW
ncbi:MAG: hypothetical protein LBN01_04355 [Endomicrobium sp.]|jgi:hypothetical protein|nr:hypothetical protein [Endomicrobium sp.]